MCFTTTAAISGIDIDINSKTSSKTNIKTRNEERE